MCRWYEQLMRQGPHPRASPLAVAWWPAPGGPTTSYAPAGSRGGPGERAGGLGQKLFAGRRVTISSYTQTGQRHPAEYQPSTRCPGPGVRSPGDRGEEYVPTATSLT